VMWKPRSSRALLNLVLIGCALTVPLARAQEAPQPAQSGEPLHIRSEEMTAKNAENKIIFKDNVVATKGDLWMRADEMVVLFVPAPASTGPQPSPFALAGANPSEIDHIDADGHVELKQGERRATADHAFYDQKLDKVILTGNPHVWEKDYEVKGQRMTIFLKENRSVVEDSQMTIQKAQ